MLCLDAGAPIMEPGKGGGGEGCCPSRRVPRLMTLNTAGLSLAFCAVLCFKVFLPFLGMNMASDIFQLRDRVGSYLKSCCLKEEGCNS